MTDAAPESLIAAHYGKGSLFEEIISAVGKPEAEISAEDIQDVDEFHIGGREATERLLDHLDLPAGTGVLDLGSGIGGPARRMAARYGWKVTGIDLTPEFVSTARRLAALTGQDVEFIQGSALELPFEDESFGLVTLIHVGMNLPDKGRLFSEVRRVLRAGGVFAVYDVMLTGDRHPDFPLPWASRVTESFLAAPAEYRETGRAAGLTLSSEADRTEIALEFFTRLAAMVAEKKVRASLPILMGEDAGTKVRHMVAAIDRGDIAPIEMVFGKDHR